MNESKPPTILTLEKNSEVESLVHGDVARPPRSLNIGSIASFGLALFWLTQVNPASIWVMGESSGLGFGTVRSSLFIGGALLLALCTFLNTILCKRRIDTITFQALNTIGILAILVAFRIVADLLQNSRLDFVGVFPFAEFIISVFLFSRINVYEWLNNNFEQIKIVAALLMLCDIALWGYSVMSGISFGVFRANISGLALNRMPDLFYAGIASFFLIDKGSGPILRIISALTIAVTLYRSAYISMLAVFMYSLYYYNWRINLKRTILRAASLVFFAYLAIEILGWLFLDGFSLSGALAERILSTFLPESSVLNEASKSERLDQIRPLLHAIAANVFIGAGFGHTLLGEPIYNYFNYVLIALVILGLPVIIAAIKPASVIAKLLRRPTGAISSPQLMVNSLVVYFLTLINVFPYMVYFPVASVFAFAVCYYLWGRRVRLNGG